MDRIQNGKYRLRYQFQAFHNKLHKNQIQAIENQINQRSSTVTNSNHKLLPKRKQNARKNEMTKQKS